MRTLYYRIEINEVGWSYNEGFVIFELDDNNQLQSGEGVLTLDYIKFSIVMNKYIYIQYFTLDEQYEMLELDFEYAIEIKEFEIPSRIKLKLSNDSVFFISIATPIKNIQGKKVCDQILEKYKKCFQKR